MTSTQKVNLFCTWSGLIYCVLVFAGWWLVGGFMPPHSPSAGADEITMFYQAHPFRIRAGLIIVMLGAAFFIPFVAVFIELVARIEGRIGPLTTITAMGGYVNAIGTFYPPLIWLTAAFRSGDRAAELTYLVNDMAWLFFIGGLLLYLPIYVSVAIATWIDRSEPRIFPRWYAYYTIFTCLAVLPDQMLFFFKSGPFAWNGVMAFWLPISVFVLWFVVSFVLIRGAILGEVRRQASGRGS